MPRDSEQGWPFDDEDPDIEIERAKLRAAIKLALTLDRRRKGQRRCKMVRRYRARPPVQA